MLQGDCSGWALVGGRSLHMRLKEIEQYEGYYITSNDRWLSKSFTADWVDEGSAPKGLLWLRPCIDLNTGIERN